MFYTKKAETFAWIIIWVAILAIILLWIWNLMYYAYDVLSQFKNANRVAVLENNLSNIVKKIDTNNILEGEIFYLHKNTSTNVYDIYTWALNVEYKYIDKYGDKVDNIVTFSEPIYSRVLWKERSDTSVATSSEIIRAQVKRLIKK